MKNINPPYGSMLRPTIITCGFILSSLICFSQRPIVSIVTSGSLNLPSLHLNIKGAGLRNPSNNSLISAWDSSGTNYLVNFNAPATYNSLFLTQFSVQGFGTPVIKMPVSAVVKIRRLSNPDVGDARKYFNFWARYSSLPISGLPVGIFNFTAPEVVVPEDAFVTNNLTSGYDNIFQNTIANPHFGNIERVDFVIPAGLRAVNDTDLIQSGVIVIDRGVGDAFKVAAITAVDANNDPVAYGPLVTVTAAQYGGNLLANPINYGILINDENFSSQSRPSTAESQNLRGVFMGLSDLGLALNQPFYGYSLFGHDVTAAIPDWTTYPNNTNSSSQLDPVNVMGLFKSTKSVLAVPLSFSAIKLNNTARLNFTLYNKTSAENVIIERGRDGKNFREIGRMAVHATGEYSYIDANPLAGDNYYRIKLSDKDGSSGNSETRMLKFSENEKIKTYPNPATDKLFIELPASWLEKNVKAELWNVAGQLVQSETYNRANRTEILTITNKQPGLYQLRLIQDENMLLKSITIIK